MATDRSLQRAAHAWCKPTTSNKVMDPQLCEAFADILDQNEACASEFRAASRTSEDGKPEGTRESLERTASMLDTYAPDLFPANEQGQIHMGRAMMESAADEIRAFLARPA